MGSDARAPVQQAQRRRRIRQQKIVTAAGVAAATAVAALVTGCAASAGQQHSAPTVTITGAADNPTPTATQPAPTATVTTSAPGPDSSAPASTAAPDGGSPQILSSFSGSGDQNTGSFTVPDTWHLSWAYWGCPDAQDNFIVNEYNTDGTPDPSGVDVNELGSGRGPVATTAYGDGGTHYFQVNTEGCSWQLVVVSGQG